MRELAWSPDGSCVLATVRGVGDEFFKLFRLELRGGTATLQAEALGDIGNPVWLPDGRSFLYQVLSNGVTSMVLASKDGPGGKVVGPTNGVLRVSHVAADGSRAYARYAGPTAPAVLVEIALGGSAAQPGAAVLVYAPSNSAEMKCPEPKTLCVRALDGSAIPGYHWTAPGRAGPPKGALIVAHGGLHTQTFPTWEAYLPALLNQGCDVIAVNYRGSSGYGHRFERMEGEPERVSDVLAARDYAVEIGRAKASGADVVMMVSHGEDAIKLIREMVKQRFEPKAIISPGSPGMYEAQFYKTLGKFGDYAVTNLPWINPRAPLSKTLLAAFAKQFPDALFEMNIGFTFEAILVAADAAKRAGSTSAKGLLEALPVTNLTDHVMIGGPIAFDAKGQNNNIHSASVQNRDQKPVVVLPGENAEMTAVLPAPGWQQR